MILKNHRKEDVSKILSSTLGDCEISMHLGNTLRKAVTRFDRESAHPSQLNIRKESCCTAANPGVTDRLSHCVGMITKNRKLGKVKIRKKCTKVM